MQKARKVQPVTVRGSIDQEAITTLNVYASNKSFKIYETKTDTSGKGNIKIHNYTQTLHHLCLNNQE